MPGTSDQDAVLGAIFRIANGSPAIPVTLGAIHSTFTDLDVRDLVKHLDALMRSGLIENADGTTGRLGNAYVLTRQGCGHSCVSAGKR